MVPLVVLRTLDPERFPQAHEHVPKRVEIPILDGIADEVSDSRHRLRVSNEAPQQSQRSAHFGGPTRHALGGDRCWPRDPRPHVEHLSESLLG